MVLKKLSIKLGVLFFFIIFGLMSAMFFILHTGITENRAEEELQALQARGNSHRAVLETHFSQETIEHVILMESESTTDVVILDSLGGIIDASTLSDTLKKSFVIPSSTIPRRGQILEDNWEKEPYISTISPIYVDDQLQGYVVMLENTDTVRSLMNDLNEHFLMAGIVSIFFTLIIIIFLSKGITKPLVKMKEGTYQISKGNYAISLPKTSDDELGDLGKSIEALAHELNYLKEQRSEFLASISHELRTPLTYIKGYADIVRKRNLTEEERSNYLMIISEETNRLSDLIKQLFELAKMDQNAFNIRKERIHLNDFFDRLEQKLAPAFHDYKRIITFECEEDLFLQADPLRLEQILVNLLDNARKFSPEDSRIEIKAWENKNKIHITVEDYGKGIPEKDIPYLFNRFYRVDKSRTRSLGGTGLGLSIVRELVQAHEGEVRVTSTVGQGTKFELIL